jgi:hypothetical protein
MPVASERLPARLENGVFIVVAAFKEAAAIGEVVKGLR